MIMGRVISDGVKHLFKGNWKQGLKETWKNVKQGFNQLVNSAGNVVEHIAKSWGVDVEEISKSLNIDAGKRLTMDDLNKVIDGVVKKAGDLASLGSQVESQLYSLQRLATNPNIRSKINDHITKLKSKADDIKSLQTSVENQIVDAKNQALTDYSKLTQAGKKVDGEVTNQGTQLLKSVNDFAGSVEQRIHDLNNKYKEI